MARTDVQNSHRRWRWDNDNRKKRTKVKFQKPRKVTLEKAKEIVVNALLNNIGIHPSNYQYFYAEKIAIECNISVDRVRQVIHILNLEGCCSQSILWFRGEMHTRLDYQDDVVQWEAKKYELYIDKLKEKYKKEK